MPITWKSFFDYIFESVNSGKMSMEHKCLFCGSKLDQDRFNGSKVRIGRLRFLLRSIEEGSKTADQLLQEILTVSAEITGRDLPEDDPDWWMELGWKIYCESGTVRSQDDIFKSRDKNTF